MWITELDRNTLWSQQTLLGVSEGLLVLKSIIKKSSLYWQKKQDSPKPKAAGAGMGADWTGVEV